MQSKSKPLDDLSNLLTNAAGAIKGVGDEMRAMGRSQADNCLLYTSPSPRDATLSRMPSSA